MEQAFFSVRLIQRTPAGLPSGIPGSGDEMETAIQQAAHPIRQFMCLSFPDVKRPEKKPNGLSYPGADTESRDLVRYIGYISHDQNKTRQAADPSPEKSRNEQQNG